ncbi:uncharacterized protein [Gossypium hirsutum]|uniref:Uncharacterized protein isoform X1 n=1 Tax=Gossypium hirsutum TaxID=3635 RepID=A0ABM3ADR8_GOSHI|nr:uncharacterized protein LOC107953813 isoform X1 [Gossypium hirsutum]XP_040953000.1 uncharacterized protein LOC107953813 isoform X1 [Gossypium hirsutum]
MQVTAVLIAAGNKLLLKIHGNKSTSKEVIHIPSYRSEVIYGGTWFSSSRKFVPSFVFAIYTRYIKSCALSDITKSKQLLDKLVVVKYNGALGKNMGFGGPEWGLENTIKGKTSNIVIPSQAVAS